MNTIVRRPIVFKATTIRAWTCPRRSDVESKSCGSVSTSRKRSLPLGPPFTATTLAVSSVESGTLALPRWVPSLRHWEYRSRSSSHRFVKLAGSASRFILLGQLALDCPHQLLRERKDDGSAQSGTVIQLPPRIGLPVFLVLPQDGIALLVSPISYHPATVLPPFTPAKVLRTRDERENPRACHGSTRGSLVSNPCWSDKPRVSARLKVRITAPVGTLPCCRFHSASRVASSADSRCHRTRSGPLAATNPFVSCLNRE
jgi:hypothetical protein